MHIEYLSPDYFNKHAVVTFMNWQITGAVYGHKNELWRAGLVVTRFFKNITQTCLLHEDSKIQSKCTDLCNHINFEDGQVPEHGMHQRGKQQSA